MILSDFERRLGLLLRCGHVGNGFFSVARTSISDLETGQLRLREVSVFRVGGSAKVTNVRTWRVGQGSPRSRDKEVASLKICNPPGRRATQGHPRQTHCCARGTPCCAGNYPRREYAEGGDLMSYGFDVADGYRQMEYCANQAEDRQGARPRNPPNLLVLADEVIEQRFLHPWLKPSAVHGSMNGSAKRFGRVRPRPVIPVYGYSRGTS